MWWGYKAAGRTVRGGARAGSRLGESLGSGLAVRSGSRGPRRGYLAPGDPPPPPTATADYLDYRGVATWQEARNLEAQPFTLGTFLDLRRGRPRGGIGLPEPALNRHAVVVGPAGSGKTAGLLIPWTYSALASGWSVVAVDVKGDLSEQFLDYRSRHGPIPGAVLHKWDFADPAHSTSWSWMAELTDDERIDAAITAIIGLPSKQGSLDPYFYNRDYRTLGGLLRFARSTARGPVSAGGRFACCRIATSSRALSQLIRGRPARAISPP